MPSDDTPPPEGPDRPVSPVVARLAERLAKYTGETANGGFTGTAAGLAKANRRPRSLPGRDDTGPAVLAGRPPASSSPPAPIDVDDERSREILDGLNEPQRRAVVHEGSPLLVVAGAGSGKTRVLTKRIAWIVGPRRAHPGEVLAITFTNKAAAEMRERVAHMVGRRVNPMWVSTFHSACVRLLRREIGAFGFPSSFSIYDDADARRLITLVSRDAEIDTKKYTPRAILNAISDFKNELVDHDTARSRADNPVKLQLAEVYGQYQQRLQAAGALDFDDLIMTTVNLFQAFPAVLEHYRARFRHVLVDEYQDTNHAQYELVRMLADPDGPGEPAELMVVGDADQSIYAFRGATIRNILQFEQDFPKAQTIMLEQNYRSTQTILSAANAVISRNPDRKPKNLWTDEGQGDAIVGYVAEDEHDEAQWVADTVDAMVDAKAVKRSDVAVFYRTNAQSRVFEEVFIRLGLPYRVVGGVRFYERREVKDAIAYLRALMNPADDVSLRRILNVPKRGIGDRAEEMVAGYAGQTGTTFREAMRKAADIPGIATRSAKNVTAFAEILDGLAARVAAGQPPAEILQAALSESGYREALENSEDPQDATRLENLDELLAVAREFTEQAVQVEQELAATVTDVAVSGPSTSADEPAAVTVDPADPTPGSLQAFLERVSLVADADAIPDEGDGLVTLMTLHTAKGLEFEVVFLTGLEDGVFPHQRSLSDPRELEEERRIAYVGITRARKKLHISRATVRSSWGAPQHYPESRFITEVPDELVAWERTEEAASSWGSRSASAKASERGRRTGRPVAAAGGLGTFGSARRDGPLPNLKPGDRVLHDTYGLGTVVATAGAGEKSQASVDFGSEGVRKLLLRYAPLEKLS